MGMLIFLGLVLIFVGIFGLVALTPLVGTYSGWLAGACTVAISVMSIIYGCGQIIDAQNAIDILHKQCEQIGGEYVGEVCLKDGVIIKLEGK